MTASNGLGVVQGGPFAGALEVSQHRYLPNGGGACQHDAILDPNTGRELRKLPSSEC